MQHRSCPDSAALNGRLLLFRYLSVFLVCVETKDFETIASVCGLTRLLDLDLDSSRLQLEPGSCSASAPEAGAAAPPQHSEALELARSAAALQRLVVRSAPGLCCLGSPMSECLLPAPVLLVAQPSHRALVGSEGPCRYSSFKIGTL